MNEPAPSPSNYRRLFANAGYVRVFSAGLGSTAGSAIAGICLVWIVWSVTGSALDIGLLGTAWLVSAIAFAVFGGTLVDRYDRRRLMILSDLSRAAALAVVVMVLLRGGFNFPVILGANFVLGAFSTLFNPAEQSIVPVLVPVGLVADANGLVRSSRSIVQFIGASLGGVLIVTLGPLTGVGINVATFVLSAALLTGMHVSSPDKPRRSPGAELGPISRTSPPDSAGSTGPRGSLSSPCRQRSSISVTAWSGRSLSSSPRSSFTARRWPSPASWRSRSQGPRWDPCS